MGICHRELSKINYFKWENAAGGKSSSPLKKKELINPWVTPALAKCINIRHNLGRLANKGRIDKHIFKRFRNMVTMKLREAKSTYYSNKFSNSKGDIKNLGHH